MVEKLLCSGNSLRSIAFNLGVNVKTVERRVPYLGEKARRKHKKELEKYEKVKEMQLDDLITKENSKLKPLSVSIAVDVSSRRILSGKVSQIPAFGKLAAIARKKYGMRACHHKKGLKAVFEEIKPIIAPGAIISSDEHQRYPEFIKKYFPSSTHLTYPSERGCIVGQGELKKVRFDPLFTINHTCAMLRYRINRLIRRTWCTTKDPARLQDHLDIFINFYNRKLLGRTLSLTPI